MSAWFAPNPPWPWGLARRPGSTISAGNPQAVIKSPLQARLGFDISANVAIGSNASNSAAGVFPATNGAVFNLSAAAIASAGAFSRSGGN